VPSRRAQDASQLGLEVADHVDGVCRSSKTVHFHCVECPYVAHYLDDRTMLRENPLVAQDHEKAARRNTPSARCPQDPAWRPDGNSSGPSSQPALSLTDRGGTNRLEMFGPLLVTSKPGSAPGTVGRR